MFRLKSLFNKNEIWVGNKKGITVGRFENNSIVLDSKGISGKHLKLYIEDYKLFVVDLGSDNGTYINTLQLKANKAYELKVRDILIIGTDKIQYEVFAETVKVDKSIRDLNKDIYTIGRASSNDLILNSRNVSRRHLIVRKNGDFWEVEDNNSKNGTYLNGFENRIEKIRLKRDEVLYLANYKLPTNRIFELIEGNKAVEQKINFNKSEIILGRDENCDLSINNPNISSKHAKITHEDNKYYILDLNSTNGTFINFNPIDGKTEIKEGDKITLGAYTFEFLINQKQNFTLIKENLGVRIDVEGVSYKIKNGKKVILNDITLSIYPGEFVGLMGLSGAGKTTLLNVMSGYNKATEGKIYINGIELYKNFETLKQFIGYVPQDDIIHPELTVYESLLYSAKLRLNLSKDEIDKRIDEVLDDLGIKEIKHNRIGSADKKGISGGERRRVNLAVELIANPDLIFLDEPTSGLSSVDTKSVMETLKKLTDSGKTIIITIHQPSLSNYKMMDNVIILTHGECAYYGQNYPNSIKFFNKNIEDHNVLSDVDNALIGLYEGEKNGIVWKDEYEKSQTYIDYVQDRINKPYTNENTQMKNNKKESSLRQFFILSKRYLKTKLRDKMNISILMAQSPLIAILLILMFFKGFDTDVANYVGYKVYERTPQILLFIIIISSVWFGMNNAVREIVFEKTIFRKERLLGLKIIPYVLSKFLILSILAFFQVIMLVLIVNYGGVPLKIDIPHMVLLAFISSLSGISIGLLLSSWVKTQASALSLLPLLLLPMIVLSGGMISVRDMSSGVHSLSLTMPTRFILEETIREYDHYKEENSLEETNLTEPYPDANNSKLVIVSDRSEIFDPIEYMKENGITMCQDKRCIEALYMKINKDDNNITFEENGYRAHPNKAIIYSIFFGWIFIPLVLTMLVLKRKYKMK